MYHSYSGLWFFNQIKYEWQNNNIEITEHILSCMAGIVKSKSLIINFYKEENSVTIWRQKPCEASFRR